MKTVNYFLTVVALIAFTTTTFAQQGKENEKDELMKEFKITQEEFKKEVADFIDKETQANNGAFVVVDKEQDKNIRLYLLKTYNDKPLYVGNDSYVLCSDFRGEDGKVYDIDILLTGTTGDNLGVAEVNIHKVDGKERYRWREVKIWEKEEVEDAQLEVSEDEITPKERGRKVERKSMQMQVEPVRVPQKAVREKYHR